MSVDKKNSFEKDKDYGWTTNNYLLTSVYGTRMESFFRPPPQTMRASPPWDQEPFPEGVEDVLRDLVPDINGPELFLFLNAWQCYRQDKEDEASWPPARQVGREILKIHDAALTLLQAIDDAHLKTISLLADRYSRLNGASPAPYMPAHLTQELCRLITAIYEDHFMFEWSKAAKDNSKGRTPMTRSGANINFVEVIYFWLEGVMTTRPTYTELQKLIDAYCGEENALKEHVQRFTNQKKET